MNIRWRLGVIGVQFLIACSLTYWITGNIVSGETWFLAGLFAVIINPQLLEPFYPRPADVIGNSLIFAILFSTTDTSITTAGWYALAIFLAFSSLNSIIALWFGSGNRQGVKVNIGQTARYISKYANAQLIYSSIFLFATIERFALSDLEAFWTLVIGWSVIIFIGRVNWQQLWESAGQEVSYCEVEEMLGPSAINVTSQSIPPVGTSVTIKTAEDEIDGIVIKRVRRILNTWGQILVLETSKSEDILTGQVLKIKPRKDSNNFYGTVEPDSTDRYLKFVSTGNLEIGDVVGVPNFKMQSPILYQISSAIVDKVNVKGGSHLVAKVNANQLGIFDTENLILKKHRWVPPLGSPVILDPIKQELKDLKKDTSNFLLGHVLGTSIPIYMDIETMSEGHLSILGMTKMGKSTLSERLAKELSNKRRVTVLDQTGEYVNKKNFKPCVKDEKWTEKGLSVVEPKPQEIPAEKALKFLKYLLGKALKEYKDGDPFPRTIIIDEAHQFIPEPAGLGFGAPGRDSSIEIGALLMQIRKYGLSVTLISQRTAVIAKSAISQCENFIVFRSVDQTGLDYIEGVAGHDLRSLVPQLNQGEAVVFGPAISSENPVAIKVYKP